MPGRTHLQHAQPVLLSHHLLAHAWPLRARRRRGCGTGTLASPPTRRTAPERSPARRSGSTRRPSPPSSASPARSANSIDGTAARDFVAEFAFVTAQIGVDVVPARRGGHPLDHARVRLRHAARLVVDGVEHHAAEEEPRHRRAGARQVRSADRQPHRPAGHPQGRCRWPTTATCRRTRSRSSTRSTPSRCCCPRSPGWSRR